MHEIQKNDAGTQGSKRQTHQALQNQLTDSSRILAKRAEEGPKIRMETNANCCPVIGLGRFHIQKELSSDHLKKCERVTCMRINTVSSVRQIVTKVKGNLTLYPKPHQFNTPLSPCKSILSHKPLLLASKLISHFKPLQTTIMAEITPEDEALIQRFIGLNTSNRPDLVVKVSANAATSTDWGQALLVRVVFDRTVLDNQFSEVMSKAWNASPDTIFRSVSRNCYLVEFFSHIDMDIVLLAGPWTFRGELVAARQVTSHLDLHSEHV